MGTLRPRKGWGMALWPWAGQGKARGQTGKREEGEGGSLWLLVRRVTLGFCPEPPPRTRGSLGLNKEALL